MKIKKLIRRGLINWLPKKAYLKYAPYVLKFLNSKRRGCEYKFYSGDNGLVYFYHNERKVQFINYKRLDRYLYKDGWNVIKNKLKNKYSSTKVEVDKGDIVIDVGANIGEFSCMASELASQVFSFEPDPKVYEVLEANCSYYQNIIPQNIALSDSEGKSPFYISDLNADSSLIEPKRYEDVFYIQCITLKKFIIDRKLSSIDFLKVEAEGAELEVIKGLQDYISRVKKIAVDGGPENQGKTTYNEVKEFLEKSGFHVQVRGKEVFAINEREN